MININFTPTPKQHLVCELFDDKTTTEIVYGGAAASGKSYLICALMTMKALTNNGIRIGLARNQISTLKKTTLTSLFEVFSDWGIQKGLHYNYNSNSGIIQFFNGSEIVLIELSYMPSDAQYTRLGGLLLTFAVVDELAEVEEKGFNILKTRVGRWKNTETNIKPIIIGTCNPLKNWLYYKYYIPYVNETLKPYQRFIAALPQDNPFISQAYIDNLFNASSIQDRQRLLYGNWNYEHLPDALLSPEEIDNIWDDATTDKDAHTYISADIAIKGDKCVVMVWKGYTLIDTIINPPDVEFCIKEQMTIHNVPQYRISIDSDGIGNLLQAKFKNAKFIHNGAKTFKNENYKNLKVQLYVKLCQLIKENKIKILSSNYKEDIKDELGQIQYKTNENEIGKVDLVSKAEIKKVLGRSCDFSDCMAYRMFFEYREFSGKLPYRII